MASDINSCTFTGNIVRDAEIKYTSQGLAICNFSIAVNKKFKDKEYTSFFSFTIFGKFGEAVSQYLVKGLGVAIEAEAKQDTWEQDGNKRSAIKFTVNNLKMFGNRNSSSGGNQGNYQGNQGNQGGYNNQRSSGPAEPPVTGGPEDFEDNIPF